jgi:hypothetical protein
MAEAGPDRSSIEIKGLLRKLHPDKGNHKDRIRRLGKFRNYVMGDGVRLNKIRYHLRSTH